VAALDADSARRSHLLGVRSLTLMVLCIVPKDWPEHSSYAHQRARPWDPLRLV